FQPRCAERIDRTLWMAGFLQPRISDEQDMRVPKLPCQFAQSIERACTEDNARRRMKVERLHGRAEPPIRHRSWNRHHACASISAGNAVAFRGLVRFWRNDKRITRPTSSHRTEMPGPGRENRRCCPRAAGASSV